MIVEGPDPFDIEKFNHNEAWCPFCAEEVYDDTTYCPYCKEYIEGKTLASHPEVVKFSKRGRMFLMAVILVGFAWSFFVFMAQFFDGLFHWFRGILIGS
tara:strand:+ start:455 stop:751 length:297 start_codon:yes stop_codon:yes gene_type:complete